MKIHWNIQPEYTGTEAENESWYVDVVLQGKQYVSEADEIIHQRD